MIEYLKKKKQSIVFITLLLELIIPIFMYSALINNFPVLLICLFSLVATIRAIVIIVY